MLDIKEMEKEVRETPTKTISADEAFKKLIEECKRYEKEIIKKYKEEK